MRRLSAVMHQVEHRQPLDKDQVIGEQSTMTSPPDALTTHDRAASTSHGIKQSRYSRSERPGLHIVRIRPEGLVPKHHMSGPQNRLPSAAKLRDPLVFQIGGREPLRHRLTTELRVPSTPGKRSDIDHALNASSPQNPSELIGGKRPVAKRAHHPLIIAGCRSSRWRHIWDLPRTGRSESASRIAGQARQPRPRSHGSAAPAAASQSGPTPGPASQSKSLMICESSFGYR